MKALRALAAQEKKAARKRRHQQSTTTAAPSADDEKKSEVDAKKARWLPSSLDSSSVSTRSLPDGAQVIETAENATHRDGSTVEIRTEETIRRRKVRRADGTYVLETERRIVTTRMERMVIPTPPAPATEEEDADAAKSDEADGVESNPVPT